MKKNLQSKSPSMVIDKKAWEDVLKASVNAENEVVHLQNSIENLTLELKDMTELYTNVAGEAKLAQSQVTYNQTTFARDKANYESRIATLLRQLETTESNKKYACDHIAEQNKLIRDAKFEMEKIRAENTTLNAERVNAGHLAKKVLELQQELTKGDYLTCPYQKRKDSLHLPCGTCVSCKLDSSYGIIERMTKQVAHLESMKTTAQNQEKFTLSVLDQTSKNLDAANKENTHLKKCFDAEVKAQAEQRKYQDHLREIIRLQGNALRLIATKAWIWERKSYAEVAIDDISAYKKQHNIIT